MTEEMNLRFLQARKKYIRSQFSQLNPMQLEAAMTTEGPLLLLAGAGSGKTTVLIHRIANLIRFGRGSETNEIPDTVEREDVLFLENLPQMPTELETHRADYLCAVEPVNPWNIIAITFTNKAANELKERLEQMLGDQARDVWAMTFHSACCRILRRFIDRLGYTKSFTIYDAADSERIMKNIIKDMGLDEKTFPAKYVLAAISKEKDRQVDPQRYAQSAEATGDRRMECISKAYTAYQTQLKDNNAVDFDDIIALTVQLLQTDEEVRTLYQRQFRYVLIDEYQDTNHLQYLLASLLSGGRENICVVGDDDQSIYRFRGATISNILDFEKQYKGSRTIRLEQNYRSTQSILNAANAVISHNKGRKGKKLWTSNPYGDPVTVYEASDGGTEAEFVAGQILSKSRGKHFGNYAILYRTNAQSNALEYSFKRNGIPYRIFGGTRFFDRAEVKDMLAYLCVLNNRKDDLRLSRIINNPPRGIGQKSIDTVAWFAQAEGKSMYEVACDPYSYGPLERSARKLLEFSAMLEGLAQLLDDGMDLLNFYDELLIRTGYVDMLQSKPTEENITRLENVRELKSSIQTYVENAEEPSLAGFLEEIALYTDIQQYDADADAVVMMTMHSAKGLEFPNVFLVGFEDGLFPGMRAIGDYEEMEEERRLCYVAITRAKESLTITHARQRMLYGRTTPAMPSRFIKEIPDEFVVRKGGYRVQPERSASTVAPAAGTYGNALQMAKATASAASKPVQIDLSKGDMVQHNAFGRGMVLSVMKAGNDALLEIAFDQIGTKRLMAKTAMAHMKKL